VTQTAELVRQSYADYLALEAKSDERYEFFDGRVFAMSGGTPAHSRLAANVIFSLMRQLASRPCTVFTADLRVRVQATGLATHPDVTVVCGPLLVDAEDPNAVVNPRVLIEILSPATERYDREEKFAHYRRIPSLVAYVLVSQAERRVEVLTRNSDQTWTLRDVMQGGARIEPIEVELMLDEVYRDPLD
jgi:Uma2 family endonuclease